ncbi:thiosulfate oxidation carrier protein SoxY [Pseudorhodoferax sp. Leaf265]|uniref:thiosulfate oxidation carrier protein SoxY n=1 Tax=Pseudorhodoferax sp. Leaf265 TaxID=1736315 RepID=UPI000AB90060|nr:thiosulfate oxidation carrier protein SoxY [Pseudorhodoferax sp. Leaf265]
MAVVPPSGWRSGALLPADATAAADVSGWNRAAFQSRLLADVVKALGGGALIESKEVFLQTPDISDNSAAVRIGVQCMLPGTTLLALLVEKNPNALAALFDIPSSTDANVATNVKMNQSSNVYALAKVGDRFHFAVREVKVTLGRCGA